MAAAGQKAQTGSGGRREELGTMPVGRLLWKLSAPSMFGVMAYHLYNLSDTIFLSHGEGMEAVGGVAVSFPLFLFLSAVSSTLGGGAASVMSRAFGEGDLEKAERAAANTFGLFYGIAALVTVTGLLFLERLLGWMGVTEALLPYAKSYTAVILLGAATSTGFSSLIRAEGNSRYAMLQWVIPMAANVVFDAVLIFVFRLGALGAAVGTVLAQCISVAMGVRYFFFPGMTALRIGPRHFLPDAALLREIIVTGLPSFLQTAGQSAVVLLVNRTLGRCGQEGLIGTYGIVSRLYLFLLFPVMGLVQGLQPVIGYNQGAGKRERVAAALRAASVAAGGYGVLAAGFTAVSAPYLMGLFTPKEAVVLAGGRMLGIICTGAAAAGIVWVQTACFQALGRGGTALLMTLCGQLLCFVPSLVALTRLFGSDGVWYAFPVSNLLALGISSVTMYRAF